MIDWKYEKAMVIVIQLTEKERRILFKELNALGLKKESSSMLYEIYNILNHNDCL